MFTEDALRRLLQRIDGRGYKAYKELAGGYRFADFTLFVDHVQGDPFASPSKIRVRVESSQAGFPPLLFDNPVRRLALEDYLARAVRKAIRRFARGSRGMGKSGLISIDAGGQEVLQRTATVVREAWVEARLQIGLPARGRTVLGREAEAMLCQELPQIVKQALFWEHLPQAEVRRFVECIENQEFIRDQLEERGLVAFVADGAILPRESGASDRPMAGEQATLFRAPESLRVSFSLPNPIVRNGAEIREISGLGIPRGITLIVGGGYHGKSTLLRALERGVYPHIPGDGREYVVTLAEAVKIRAEDGRRVEQVDISPFINNLPNGRSTTRFCTDDASGSTSQAANIIEAVEMGARLLLLDEDTSATNFMIRDARMQALVHKEDEPITPFLDRVREMYHNMGVSTVLVMGGSGDYLEVADTVIMMRNFLPREVTSEAKKVVEQFPTRREREDGHPFRETTPRIPLPQSFDPSRGKKEVKIDAKSRDLILFGREPIDLRQVEQLVDLSQTRAVGYAIHLAVQRFMDGKRTLREVVAQVERFFDQYGLDELDPFHRAERHPGNFARPRRFEIAAAINRLRTVRMRQREK